jgi:hypothetical protein
VPLVLFGLFRYWYVIEKLDGGESPTDGWHTGIFSWTKSWFVFLS